MKHLPSLKQLEYLVALADTQHFGHASQRCNITPSTISAGIRDLENILGVDLAERNKRHVLMTSVGQEIAARARALLRDAQDVMDLASANQQAMSGDMRLGVIPTISPFLLPRVLPALSTQYPNLRLYLREEQTEQLLSRLRAADIDVALIALPFDTSGLNSAHLFEDDFKFACNATHPMAALQEVTLDTLTEQPLMLLEEGHCLREHALDACQFRTRQMREQFEASSIHTLVQMVASGIGVTLLPKLAIDANVTHGTDIKLIPLAQKACREIGLVWSRSSLSSSDYELLAEAIRAIQNER